jgi:hypothetical protein
LVFDVAIANAKSSAFCICQYFFFNIFEFLGSFGRINDVSYQKPFFFVTNSQSYTPMRSVFGLCFLTLLFAACGNDPKPPAPISSPASAPANDPRPAVYLEGVYATSEAEGQPVQHLFDADLSNYWQTRPGTGPDEGVMLYFQNALPIAAVQLVAKSGSFEQKTDHIPTIQLFVNGAAAARGLPGDKIQVGEKAVKSLFVRFEATGKEQITSRNESGSTLGIETYPNTTAVAIQALHILNEKGEILRLVPPSQVAGTVIASSTLDPESAYSAANLFDAHKEFVWVEGNKNSAGVGETIRFRFQNPQTRITALQIWNGYQRSDEHFGANARLRDFEFGAASGPRQTYTLRDTKAGQKIDLSAAAEGSEFILTIKSEYPGKKYKDLAISDIVFYDGDQPFVLSTPQKAAFVTENRNKTANSPLAALLDRRISNQTEVDEVSDFRSLVLRSDGTFVVYSLETVGAADEGSESEIIADGNWEYLKSDANAATIKIFGRWSNLSKMPQYYAGNNQSSVTNIFNDQLNITAQKIEGSRWLGTYWVK